MNNNILDSQFWNQCYIDKNTGWDLGEVTPIFKDWCNNLKKKSKILVPGSGNGYDPLYFASLGHDVLAVDFSDLAINRIESEADKNKIKIQTLNCDFFDLDSKFKNQFDYIIEYTFFCAISPNDRDKYITMTHNLLNDSGSLIGLFFPLNKDKADGGPPFSVSLEEIKDSFSKKFKLINCFNHPLSIEPRKNNEQYFEYKKILV